MSVSRLHRACTVRQVRPSDSRLRHLFEEAESHYAGLYSAADNAAFNAVDLNDPSLLAFLALAGEPAGCILLRVEPDWAEIKRLYVARAARRIGAGRMLVEAAIAAARERGVRGLRLETGAPQHEALRLYAGLGFAPCERFGDYPPHPLSRFLALDLKRSGNPAAGQILPLQFETLDRLGG